MENAVDALKIGFAVLVFVMALSLTMFMFTNARESADIVLHSSDLTAYMEYIEPQEGSENRIVGLETIIPTLYKYYKENYTVIFRDASGGFLELYETATNTDLWSTGYTNKYYSNKTDTRVCSFDVNEETRRHEPWTGNEKENKRMLDIFIQGGTYTYTDSIGLREIKFKGLSKYEGDKFIESLGEYEFNANNNEASDTDYNSGLIKNKKKRVIIYTLQN